MTIDLKLDTRAIDKLVRRLERLKEEAFEGLVENLVVDGAEVARVAYGSMATATGYVEGETDGIVTGKIVAYSENEDKLLIAEFGAGDATLYPRDWFDTRELDAWVFPGAYSLFKGTMEYWSMHQWEFPRGSGHWMTEVEPKQGMYQAKRFIEDVCARYASEVIRLD